jgi:hypothetical protein
MLYVVRTTLIIDDDVMFLARDLARARRTSVSAVISDLAREGFRGQQRATAGADEPPGQPGPGGLPRLPSRGGVVTNEQVNNLREHLGI